AAAREDNGYRRYSGVHVSALSAYRDLAFAIGPVAARSVMTELPRLDPKEAIALLTSTVTEVDELRRQVVAARSMLLSIQSEASVESETGDERGGGCPYVFRQGVKVRFLKSSRLGADVRGHRSGNCLPDCPGTSFPYGSGSCGRLGCVEVSAIAQHRVQHVAAPAR